MNLRILDSGEHLTDEKIKRFEERVGRTIPGPYRTFLLEHNGGRPDPSDFRMAGARPGQTTVGTVRWFLGIDLAEETFNLDYLLETFQDRVPANLFPVARDPGGNLLCLAGEGSNAGKVYFWDHEREADEGETPTDKNLYFIADSFADFLESLG